MIVIGVHSPMFPAERETSNLREAVLRYRIEHPVVHDRDFAVRQQYGGRAWPTIMFVDPEGRLIAKHEGELPFEAFDPLVSEMLAEFEQRGLIRPGQPPVSLEEIREPEHTLKFPGKVLATGTALYIADTNHHPIVEAGLDGRVRRAIGSGHPGLVDGAAEEAQFQQPQGIAIDGQTLYVADTENHAIRAVDLAAGSVLTIAGTGEQGYASSEAGKGRSVALSSPWDLALGGAALYVDMAGTHQIWTLDLEASRVRPFAGTGREGLEDGVLQAAWFAQSSGLALMNSHLYVADSEVSAIRDIDLRAGTVSTLVGGGLPRARRRLRRAEGSVHRRHQQPPDRGRRLDRHGADADRELNRPDRDLYAPQEPAYNGATLWGG